MNADKSFEMYQENIPEAIDAGIVNLEGIANLEGKYATVNILKL